MASPATGGSTVIRVENLVKRYRKAQRNAVDGISFDVGAGEFFALLGPNGAGKTTTISILTTTLAPTAGRATIDGRDIVAEASAVRREVGIIFQRPSLDLNLTAEENVRFHAVLYGLYPYAPALPADGRRLPPAGARDWRPSWASNARSSHPVRTYSGGMRRKLEIVRSLIHRPRVLFLDEPTAGLDAPSRRTLWDYLRDGPARERHDDLPDDALPRGGRAGRPDLRHRSRADRRRRARPAALKAELAREYLVVDADDRPRLRRGAGTPGPARRRRRPVPDRARRAEHARDAQGDRDAADAWSGPTRRASRTPTSRSSPARHDR